MSPNAYIIAGPNGAGKTTFARRFLPIYGPCENFVNADLIAQGLSPFAPEKVAARAGRLLLEEIENLTRRDADFAFETTMAGRTHLNLIRALIRRGYKVHMFYIWISSVDQTLSRIRDRVLHGGHSVPEEVVRRRFERSIKNFFVDYRPLADRWYLFSNSSSSPVLVASQEGGSLLVVNRMEYNDLVRRYGAE
jgi:predicted ABC-type ATPase